MDIVNLHGGGHPSGKPIRQVLEELADEIDWSRLHFLGRIPHSHLLGLLQASWVHVYLSYPFVLGWSALEAMAADVAWLAVLGCRWRRLLATVWRVCCSLDDPHRLADRILALLRRPNLRVNSVVAPELKLCDQSRTLPRLHALIQETAGV